MDNENLREGKCQAKTEVYSRCCGFFRPVQNWNPGKQTEFSDRTPYEVPELGVAE